MQAWFEAPKVDSEYFWKIRDTECVLSAYKDVGRGGGGGIQFI